MKQENYIKIMVESYIRCALWSSTMDDGEPFDSVYACFQIDDESKQRAIKACTDFYLENQELLAKYWEPGQAGHDLWLSRNGHGAGFFDRTGAPKEVRDTLQQKTNKLGERHCFSLGEEQFGIE